LSRQWKAIVLAAGRGHRLDELTDDCPKSLLPVGGVSILERALHNLAQQGVEQTVLVVGYRADSIKCLAGDSIGPMRLTYVENPRFDETNTAYSLWMAREFLRGGCLLLEGDIVFEEAVLSRILTLKDESVWAGVLVAPGRDEGVLLETNSTGRVVGCQLVRRSAERPSSLLYKCAGIQRLSSDVITRLVMELEKVVQAGKLHVYADLVLGKCLHVTDMRLCLLDDLKWAEIDDAQDLRYARALFDERVIDRVAVVSEESR
jgi:choline kinase